MSLEAKDLEEMTTQRSKRPWSGDVHDGVAAWLGASTDASIDAEPGSGPAAPGAAPIDEASVGPPADPEAVARKILLDQLTGQARSRAELSAKLAKRDVPAELASRLLDRFEEVGLIDDEAFARAWVASRQPGKGLAGRALRQELRRKGVDDEVVGTVLAEVPPETEEAVARALVRKKLRTARRLEPQVATRRLVGMLARKGHNPGLAYRVVREELGADPGEPGDVLLDD